MELADSSVPSLENTNFTKKANIFYKSIKFSHFITKFFFLKLEILIYILVLVYIYIRQQNAAYTE